MTAEYHWLYGEAIAHLVFGGSYSCRVFYSLSIGTFGVEISKESGRVEA